MVITSEYTVLRFLIEHKYSLEVFMNILTISGRVLTNVPLSIIDCTVSFGLLKQLTALFLPLQQRRKLCTKCNIGSYRLPQYKLTVVFIFSLLGVDLTALKVTVAVTVVICTDTSRLRYKLAYVQQVQPRCFAGTISIWGAPTILCPLALFRCVPAIPQRVWRTATSALRLPDGPMCKILLPSDRSARCR